MRHSRTRSATSLISLNRAHQTAHLAWRRVARAARTCDGLIRLRALHLPFRARQLSRLCRDNAVWGGMALRQGTAAGAL